MSDFNSVASASIEQAAYASIASLALELGITDISGIKNVGDLFEAWVGGTRDVPIFSLLNMAAQVEGMTLDGKWGEALADFGSNKLKTLADELLKASKIFAEHIANDPELQKSIVNLDIMQTTIFPLVEFLTGIYSETQKIIGQLEPYMPYIELLIRAAGIWINPMEVQGFSQDSFKLAMKELSKVTRLLYADFKIWLIEETDPIKVPEILMGMADGILDPSYSFDDVMNRELEEGGIGDITDTNWFDVGDLDINPLVQKLGSSIAGAVGLNASLQILVGSFGVEAFSWFSNFYQNLLDTNELEDGHSRVSVGMSLKNIQRYSKDILDLLAVLGNKSFTVDTMLKLGVNQLAKDGAIVDYGTLHYDEKLTEKGGESLRKRFYDLNNTINAYHDILSVIKGETRFNITEKIPVVDFYEDYFSLQEMYEDIEHTEVSTLDTEDLDLNDLYSESSHLFHTAIINAALKKGTSFEEIFYHPDYTNLEVDSTGANGSPFLAGKFGESPTRNNDDKIVSWELVDERTIASTDNSSADITIGTKYNNAFLEDSGWYVPRPLTSGSHRGYANELYAEVAPAIGSFKAANDYTGSVDWNTEDVLRLSEASYNGEGGTHRLEILGDMTTLHAAWTSHISGDTFTVDNSDQFTIQRSLYLSRRNGSTSYMNDRADAVANSLVSSGLTRYEAGTLNEFSAAVVLNYSGSDHLKFLSIRSPYDILKEKYLASAWFSPTFTGLGKDMAFLYSATTFGKIRETVRTRVPITNWITLFFIKIFKGRSYRTVVSTRYTGEVQATDPSLYLVTKNAISNISIGDSLFFYGKEGEKDKTIGFKINAISEFAMPTNIKVDTGNNIMDSADAGSNYLPGTACWVYKLENLELSSVGFNYDPFCYPYDDFVITNRAGHNTFRWSSLQRLRASEGRRGLPLETDYATPLLPHGNITPIALEKMMGAATIGAYLRDNILGKPLIQESEGGSTVVTLGEAIVIFETIAKYGNIIKNLPIAGSEIFLKYKTRWATYANTLKKVLNLKDFRLDDIDALDNLFGDTLVGGDPVLPWIEITDTGSALYINETILSEISSYIISHLEGVGSGNYLKRVKDGVLTGRKDGLYYKRYLVLNQRMNKSSGPLYLAGSLERSNTALESSSLSTYDQLEIIRYGINALPVHNMQKLVFINNKFIDNAKYDMVRKGIGDKCLLTCGVCHVKHICPYYNEHEVILTMLNKEDTFSIYLKDNKLDLASSVKINGEEMHSVYRKYHFPYSEIDHGDVRIIDDLIEEIDQINPGFVVNGVPEDNMGWVNKARYGTIDIGGKSTRRYESTVSECSVRAKDLYTPDNKYLYDALFIEDTETSFDYSSGQVIKLGANQVSIREANSIKAFSDEDEIFLVSNDGYDPIYLGKLKELGLQIQNPQTTKAYAQAYINLADYENPNQVWSLSNKYLGKTYAGRLRRISKTELLGDGSYTKKSILAGKPNFRRYTEFLREVKIPIVNIKWALSGKPADIIEAKKSLPFFTTDVRLANVQR